jgi:hypothetical protein
MQIHDFLLVAVQYILDIYTENGSQGYWHGTGCGRVYKNHGWGYSNIYDNTLYEFSASVSFS